ncbi:GNAT family N-acetyltransferase [Chitinophaga sp. Cy-1792]|uniref:GNAT family N-acetyltransferase n=1 Tax=Chitinophaga sp. Cy-1792 TaxID=2608339 RepID=UPI00141FF306|nr:GNAT family N-acetyltransferase [Chitinophaga sp. Cy-1792]NIG55198.1 GNAT family N-acetyltransferase [Chitinophaga sp. Cy-1792]
MAFNIQPVLENDKAMLKPLQEKDFDEVYAAAADPLVWEQHPNKDRYKEEVFRTYFEGAMASKGAFKIIDKQSGKVAGSTRFYDYNPTDNSIMIGYTFYAREFWGKGLNMSVKKLMLDYIFQYVDKVIFQVGATNTRSQIAIGRVGAVKTGEEMINYYGEAPKFNFIYTINKTDWKHE